MGLEAHQVVAALYKLQHQVVVQSKQHGQQMDCTVAHKTLLAVSRQHFRFLKPVRSSDSNSGVQPGGGKPSLTASDRPKSTPRMPTWTSPDPSSRGYQLTYS